MQKENRMKNQLEEIESQLFQIKILLLIFMALCLLGFYDILNSVIKILIGIGILIPMTFLIIEIVTIYLRKKRIDQEIKKIIDKTESEKEGQESTSG